MTDVSRFLFLLSALCATRLEAAKILAYFPTPSFSHQIVFRPLTLELARRGHDVTVVTADPIYRNTEAPTNFTEVDVHNLSYGLWREHFLKTSTGDKDDLFTQIKTVLELMNVIMEKQFLDRNVMKVLDKKNKYDLIIIEAYARQLLVLSHIFKVPMILFSSLGSSFGNYQTVGAPTHEILYPTNIRQRQFNLTLWEKVKELYTIYRMYEFHDRIEDDENVMLKRVFGDVPTISELKNNVDMMFLNIHPIWEGIRPVPPNVIHVHGINEITPKDLPADLKNYLDSSKHGVIYISFGTNVKPSLLPPERVKIIVNVMANLTYDILWKWDVDILAGKTKFAKWLPQADLLRHPKIKLFITQGGLQSTDEAINAGVPLIGIPMLGDQWYNVEKYMHHGIGKQLDLKTMTEEELRDAVTTIIGDETYRQNVIRLRSLMRDESEPPLQRAVWWTEYVLRHSGARHLRCPAANMPWHQYLELELVFTVLGVIAAGLTAVIVVLVQLCKFVKEVPERKMKGD